MRPIVGTGATSLRASSKEWSVPRVTVVIPTYDRPRTLRRAVGSVLRQTMGDLECIVVDDASPNGVPDLVEEFGDPRLRVLRQPRNGGQAAARNAGILAGTGEWIAFLDDDDEWFPDKLARQLDQCTGDVRYGPYDIAVDDHVVRHQIELPTGDVLDRVLSGWSPALTSCLLVRRSAIGEGYDPLLDGIEDHDLLIRLARTQRFGAVTTPLAIVDKTPTPTRHTFRVDARLAAIDRLEQKWSAILDDEQGAALASTCDDLRLVARVTVGHVPAAERPALLLRTLARPLPRRTRLAACLRLVVGPAATARIHRAWFRHRGEVRSSSSVGRRT